MRDRNTISERYFVTLLALVLILTIPVAAQDAMNEFVIGVSETIVTLDLGVRSPSLAHKQVAYAIYEPLLRLGTDGSINPASGQRLVHVR